MIQTVAAPSGSAFAVLDVSGMSVAKVTGSKALTPSDTFQVWGSLNTTAAGGEANLYPLGTVQGSAGLAIPQSPIFALSWTRLVFQRLTGANAGSIEAQGAAWARAAPVVAAIPTSALGYSAPLDMNAAGETYALSLDDVATSADVYNVWGTNDSATRTPASGAGGTPFPQQLKGGGKVPPLVITGYRYVIVECLTHGAASNVVAVQTPNGGNDVGDQPAGSIPPVPLTYLERDASAHGFCTVFVAGASGAAVPAAGLFSVSGSGAVRTILGALDSTGATSESLIADDGADGYTYGGGLTQNTFGGSSTRTNVRVGTNGTIQFLNGAGATLATMLTTAANPGWFGIGVGTPLAALHVVNTVAGASPPLAQFTASGTSSVRLQISNLGGGGASRGAQLFLGDLANHGLLLGFDPGATGADTWSIASTVSTVHVYGTATGIAMSGTGGTSPPDPSACLDLSQNTALGFALPRPSAATIAALASPLVGLTMLDITNLMVRVNINTPGAPIYSRAAGGPILVATNSNPQSIPSNTSTQVTGWTASENRGSAFASDTFTAPVAGNLLINVSIQFAAGTSVLGNPYRVSIVQNGSIVRDAEVPAQVAGLTIAFSVSMSRTVKVAAGDAITIQAFQHEAGALALSTSVLFNTWEASYID